jgi:enoyl-CoA hydratase
MMSCLKIEVEDFVATVTLANPPVNSASVEMMLELTATFDAFNESSDVRAVLLTAEGKTFCAGADLKNRPGPDAPAGTAYTRQRMAREMSWSMVECSKPIVVAVNGAALGAGLGIVASCDIIVASERAVFGLPEIDVGLAGGAKHALRFIPHSLARRMVLTGWRVPAEELYRRGLIEAALPHEEYLDYARTIAKEIASKSPLAVAAAKDSLNVIDNLSLRDGYRYEQGNTLKLSKSDDAKEAVKAFIEKRPPVFQGK